MWHYEAKRFKSKTFERMQRQKVNANAKPFEPETFGLENLEVTYLQNVFQDTM